MTTRKTSTLIKAIKGDLATIGNQVGAKRNASLAALGGRIYANRRKVLRALEYYEREFGTDVYTDLVPAAPSPTGRSDNGGSEGEA